MIVRNAQSQFPRLRKSIKGGKSMVTKEDALNLKYRDELH